MKRLFIALLIVSATLAGPAQAEHPAGFSRVKPEAVGFSSGRLRHLDETLQRLVDQKQVAGMVTIAARHGKIFHSGTYGLQDIATGTRMSKDAIFRIYSMTKPVTGIALMILYEEGKWNPQDPIAKHIPEFANLKVFKEYGAYGNMILKEPSHQPTMRELMTHTAGFTYGFGNEPVDKLYRDDQGRNAVMEASSLQEMIDRLAKIPLAFEPGTQWFYSIAVDIQGYLVEKLSGQPFPVFLQQKLFGPLGMTDTAFYVPKDKWSRFASYYQRNDQGELEVVADVPVVNRGFDKAPPLPSGGGGLVSTAADYLKFAQMLLNGGQLNGVRILGPQTVKMLSANHMPDPLMSSERASSHLKPGLGFGFDFAVITDPGLIASPAGHGTYYWGGAAGTWFWIDPENDLVFVGMVQHQGDPNTWALRELTQQTLYQALIDPAK